MGTWWRGALVGHDVFLGPSEDVEAAIGGSSGAKDRADSKEGVEHQTREAS